MKYWALCLLAFTIIGCTSSLRITYLQIPKETVVDTVDIKMYEQKYGKYDGVFLMREESIEHTGNKEVAMYSSSWDYHYVIKRKYIVLNPDAQYLTTFSLSAENSEIGALYLRMTPPGGLPQQWGKKDLIKQEITNGRSRYKFIYPNVVKGTIIEEGFEISYDANKVRPPLQHEIDLQFSIPCERLDFQYAYPDWWVVDVKRIRENLLPNTKLVRDMDHHKKVMTYHAENIPAITTEPFSPYFKEMAEYLDFMVQQLNMGGYFYNGSSTWDSYASKFKPYLMENDGGFLSTKVMSTTKSVIQTAETPYQKVEAIYQYLQSTIKLVHESKERDFADVINDKKGDSYEITGLAYSMLKEAKLEPYYLLIHSAQEGYFDSDYFAFNQISIPAVMVSLDGREIVMFPYREDLELGSIPQYAQGQNALFISDKKSPEIRMLAVISDTATAIEDAFDITVDEEGVLKVKEKKHFRDYYATWYRESLAQVKEDEREKFVKDMMTYTEGDVKLNSFSFENEKEKKLPFVVNLEYTIDNLVTLTPEEILFHTAGLLSPAALKTFRIETEERKNPIKIYADERLLKSIVLHYPEQWNLTTELAPVTLENTFGSLQATYEKKKGELVIQQRRYLRRSSEPKEKIKDFAQLAGLKSKVALPTLIFSRPAP